MAVHPQPGAQLTLHGRLRGASSGLRLCRKIMALALRLGEEAGLGPFAIRQGRA
jgi:hypothetical protein